jgi:hypothetical protein
MTTATTSRRIEANRRNARLHSTGPRTRQGKARSSLNAVTHGLTAKTVILPGEDPVEHQQRLIAWAASLQPCNTYESELVREAVDLSWRLDRADRVQAGLLAQRIATQPEEEDRRRKEDVADLGRRLLPPPRQPNLTCHFGVWLDLDALAIPPPDDPNDPARLLLGLESSADGCRWLLDRWAELRPVVDGGIAWSEHQMVHAIRLLGKQPLEAADDSEVLSVILACFALDRERPDPFAALWENTTRRETRVYRERLLGRRLRETMPRSKERAREVLLEIVDAAVARLEPMEAEHRQREAACRTLQPACLSFDDSPEAEWVRRQQQKSTRAMLRIVGWLRDARCRGAALTADPPARRQADRRSVRPGVSQSGNGADGAQRDGARRGEKPPRGQRTPSYAKVITPRVLEPGKSVAMGRSLDPSRPQVNRNRSKKRKARIDRIITRLIPLLASQLMLLPFVTAIVPTEGSAPPPNRPAVSASFMHAVVGHGVPGHPVPELSGRESAPQPLNGLFHTRNRQNEAKLGGFAWVLPAIPPRLDRQSDHSRGPPGPGGDLSSADRPNTEPPNRWALAVPRALGLAGWGRPYRSMEMGIGLRNGAGPSEPLRVQPARTEARPSAESGGSGAVRPRPVPARLRCGDRAGRALSSTKEFPNPSADHLARDMAMRLTVLWVSVGIGTYAVAEWSAPWPLSPWLAGGFQPSCSARKPRPICNLMKERDP